MNFKKLFFLALVFFQICATAQTKTEKEQNPAFSTTASFVIPLNLRMKLDVANVTDRQRMLKGMQAANMFTNKYVSGQVCGDSQDVECWVQTEFGQYIAMDRDDWDIKAVAIGYTEPMSEGAALWKDELVICPKLTLQDIQIKGHQMDFVYKLQKVATFRTNISVNRDKQHEYLPVQDQEYLDLRFRLNDKNQVIDIIPPQGKFPNLIGWQYEDMKERANYRSMATGKMESRPYYFPLVAFLEKAAKNCQ